MKYFITREYSIIKLKKLFPDPTKDAISVDELYINAGRNLAEGKQNKMWRKNTLFSLKQHSLISVLYEKGYGFPYERGYGFHKITSIELTNEGKIALGRLEDDSSNDLDESNSSAPESTPEIVSATRNEAKAISLVDVINMVSELSERDQGSKFTIDIKLKEGMVSIRRGQD